MDAVTSYQVARWGIRAGLKLRELRLLVTAIDRFAADHDTTRRQALEWAATARDSPDRRIFIAGSRHTVRIANPKVRTLAERALVNQARWPDNQLLNQWLDTRPGLRS